MRISRKHRTLANRGNAMMQFPTPATDPGCVQVAAPCRNGCRILVTGASGSGSSTLGRGLTDRIASQHFEVDDFFWEPTDPPFISRRAPEDRVALMQAMFLPRSNWVLSGSILGWGEDITRRLTHVIFVHLDPDIRMERLARREARRYGDRIGPGGDRASGYRAFMEWARGYDRSDFPQRSRRQHEEWLSRLSVPVLRLDTRDPSALLTAQAMDWIIASAVQPQGCAVA